LLAVYSTANAWAPRCQISGGATSNKFGNLSQADDYGIDKYKNLRESTKGSDLEAHHIIEKRFSDLLGVDSDDMSSVVVTGAEHQRFTNAWRSLIPYGEGTRAATREQLWRAAQQIYKDYPALLEAARKTLDI
jgi:hypothetical protein